MNPVVRRVTALVLALSFFVPTLPLLIDRPEYVSNSAEAQVAVYDVTLNLTQVLHYVERVYEIWQKGVLIYQDYQQMINSYRELEYWLQMLERNEVIPYREAYEVAEFLYMQGIRMKEMYRGYQAIAWSLENEVREFDATFPGWDAVDFPIVLHTQNGTINIRDLVEHRKYQAHRVMGALRNALHTNKQNQRSILRANLHQAELKELAEGAEGTQAMLELQTSFEAHGNEQLTGIRGQLQVLTDLAITEQARVLDEEMRQAAMLEKHYQRNYLDLISELGYGPDNVPPLQGGGWNPLGLGE